MENDELIFGNVDPITLEELDLALKEMKNRKATGEEGMNAELWKYGGPVLSQRLLSLINMCYNGY